ncbi:hypothetical protein LguiA_015899 [Lonicera macranthoides]
MGSCVNNNMMMMISTAPTSGKLSTKCPLLLVSSVTHHTSSFTFTHLLHNNPVTTATTTTLCGSLSAHSAISSIRGRRSIFNGKSKYICCNSLLTSDIAPTASAAYGSLLLAGGLFAYTRTGSKGSLLGGLTGALLMSTAYFLMQASEMKDVGDALAFGSALLFASVFGIRLAATRKLIPAAPLLGLSIAALAVFFSAYVQDRL